MSCAHGRWRHYWADSRIQWDPKQYGGVASIVMSPQEIWTPDVVVYSLNSAVHPGIESVSISPDGSCRWLSQRVLTVGCGFNLDHFPFDSQYCNFTVGSNSHGGNVFDVRPRAVDPSAYLAVGWDGTPLADNPAGARLDRAAIDMSNFWFSEEMALTKVRVISHERFYSCCPDSPYPEIVFEFTLRRMATTYVTGIIVPLLVATISGFTVLLMPAPVSGSRPALNVSIMFTTTAIYFVAGQKLPDLSKLTLISRIYVVSLSANLLLTLTSVLSTAMNLVTQEKHRNASEAMQRYLMYDKDKNGELDEQEARAALTTLGIANTRDQNHLFHKAGVSRSLFAVTPEKWSEISKMAMAFRETVHYNLFTASLYDWLHRRAAQQRSAVEGKRELQRSQRRLSINSSANLALANGLSEMGTRPGQVLACI